MSIIGESDIQVASQISGPSSIEIIGKYFLHGFVFTLATQLITFGVGFYGYPFEVFTGYIGTIIIMLIALISIPWVNADICKWLWDFSVQRYWPRLLAHGIILFSAMSIMGFIFSPISIFLFANLSPETYWVLAGGLICIVTFVLGFAAKVIGSWFKETL
ncbi:MAG: hypothetical protein ACFFED_10155 [Candidatus Thorarchaeota archaeon]